MNYGLLILLGILALCFITQSWFWKLASWIGFYALVFTLIASIAHFQILAAFGSLCGMLALCFIYGIASKA